ncbi:outer membrane receptor protein involved in Fe transport [Chitinophaga dinghuensis]|uniref:Outer membrane receptor protein involved in Fe transport n=1 Tax=Chitinophaga dinghuensis TaxID=1539050 RepID=A0A327VYF0_9BACT|nr:TonB-dependent receptor [Chitinophaga dinghuensis]RAJ76782.1 outer membrane receptor protein involved in Fe transport [Chitinophaga dinghuensis]
MKRITLLLLAILSVTYVFGQQYSIKGLILNQRKEPMAFMYVGLMKQDSIPVQQMLTDTLGRFAIKAEKGQYRLLMKQFGKECLSREVVLNKDLDLGLIEIKEETTLQGVTVASRKKLVEQRVDRLVFNVENAVMPTGGTALDALKATPGVRVQQENISIVGKGEVLVMIDDRLQRMSQEDLATFLKTIPADNIKSIEVITAPPAQYDAEGNSGLINIKLKRAKANTWDATIGTTYNQRTYASGSVQGLFNYNHSRLALQVSVNKGKEKLLTTSDGQIFYTHEQWNQQVKNKSQSDVLSTGLGIDYKISDKWSTGVKYLGSFTDKNFSNQPFTSRIGQDNTSYIASDVNGANKPAMNAVNWHHAIALDSMDRKVTIDFDYFSYQKKDFRLYSGNELDQHKGVIPGSYFAATNSNINKIHNLSGKADISLPYKWANVNVGAKASYTNTNNDLVVYDLQTGGPVLNTGQSNVFNYKEYNEAIYFSAGKKINNYWETQVGLRIEATQTKGYSLNLNQTNANDYIKLFPTAYITYEPDANNTFSFNYSRRIRRPDFDYLNPFVIRTSPYFYSEGNPFLKPSYIDNLELSYVKNQNWVNSVYYSRVTDFGQALSIVDSVTNVTRQTPMNYANTYQIGFSTYYNFNKLSWWNSATGFNVNYQHVTSKTGIIQSTDGYNGYCYTNNDFTLNSSKTVFLGINYALQLPGRYQIFQISTLHILDVSMKFLLANKKFSVTLTGEDLLNAQRPLISYYSNGIKNTVRSYGDSRGFRVALSYKLGKNIKTFKQRAFGNEEERSRAN